MKKSFGPLIFASLIFSAISGTVQAASLDTVNLFVDGAQAYQLLQSATKTTKTAIQTRKVFGVTVDQTYDVYTLDSNWTCYRPNSSEDTATMQFRQGLLTNLDQINYCLFQLNQNPGAKPTQNIQIDIQDTTGVNALVKSSGVTATSVVLNVPYGFSRNTPVNYDRFAMTNFECFVIQNPDDRRMGFAFGFGATALPPDRFCRYTSN